MEILSSSSSPAVWSIHERPKCTCKCDRAWRSISMAMTNASGSETSKEEEKGFGVLEMINSSSAVESKPWWAPLFSFNTNPPPTPSKEAKKPKSDVVFTDQKARLLRRRLRATECWEYRGMYHSAVATRLALTSPHHHNSSSL